MSEKLSLGRVWVFIIMWVIGDEVELMIYYDFNLFILMYKLFQIIEEFFFLL